MCKCTPEIRTPFCGRGDCLPPGYANLGEWLGIFSDAEVEAAEAEATKLREAALNHRCAWHKKYTSSFQQLQPCDGGGYCLAARSIIAEAEGRIIRAAALGTTEASK